MTNRKNRPPKALLRGIQKLFDEHGWGGIAVAAESLTSVCEEGYRPMDITEKSPSGAWVTRTICVPIGRQRK